VVPLPWHRDRVRKRRYKQAGLISKPLAERLVGLLRQVLWLWKSVRGAFATRTGSQVDNKRVLLVDDVRTSGAPLDECVRSREPSRYQD